jgi:hypothetical protein
MENQISKQTPDLSGHDSMVAMDAIWWLAESAAGFNKYTGISYSNGLDQGLLWLILGRYKDGVHWIIWHSFTHMFVVKDYRNIVPLKFIAWPDST